MVKMWSDKNQPSLQDKHVWDFDEKCNIRVAGPCLASCKGRNKMIGIL